MLLQAGLLRPLALCAALISMPPLAKAECNMVVASHLKLGHSNGHVTVPVTLNGQTANMIFDTGAFTSLLSLKAVARLGLPHMHEEETEGALGGQGYHGTVSGIGGSRTSTAVTAHNVDIGGLKARDYNFIAADLEDYMLDGLLSVDLISKFDVDLDFPENQIILYQPTGDCTAPAAFLNSPLYSVNLRPEGVDRRPRIQIMVNSQPVVALIDTGAPSSAIYRRAAERVGLRMQDSPLSAHGKTGGIGPQSVDAVRQRLKSVTVGDLEFDNMPVEILDDRQGDEVEMLLGADFQRNVHLWISYSSHTLIMQYPPTASKQP